MTSQATLSPQTDALFSYLVTELPATYQIIECPGCKAGILHLYCEALSFRMGARMCTSPALQKYDSTTMIVIYDKGLLQHKAVRERSGTKHIYTTVSPMPLARR